MDTRGAAFFQIDRLDQVGNFILAHAGGETVGDRLDGLVCQVRRFSQTRDFLRPLDRPHHAKRVADIGERGVGVVLRKAQIVAVGE